MYRFSSFFYLLLTFFICSNSVSTSYNQTEAIRDVYFAYAGYCSRSSLESWTCKWCALLPGFKISNVVDADDLQAYIGYDTEEKQIVLSFRGTSNIPNWLDDLDYTQIPYPGVSGGLIHQGFYDSWLDMSTSLMNSMKSLMKSYPNHPILITGHSLGAALAQIAALNVSTYANEIHYTGTIYLYTYGSPRWGNLVMADYFGSLIKINWRLVNMHDVVPTVPPQSADGYSYHHTWTEVWYTSDSPLKYTICDSSGEDPACSYVTVSIDDHLNYMDVYESC